MATSRRQQANKQMQAASPWHSIELSNFRRFRSTGEIGFRPITIFFGKNSSGKTTVLRSPLLLKQLAESQRIDGEIPLSGPFVDLGSYRDLVSDSVLSRDIEITCVLDPANSVRRFRLARSLGGFLEGRVAVTIRLHWNVRNSKTQMSSVRVVTHPEQRVVLTLERKSPNQVKMSVPEWRWSRTLSNVPELSLAALRFYPSMAGIGREEHDRDPELVLFAVGQLLDDAALSLNHIGPLRDMPARAYRREQGMSLADASSSIESISMLARRPDAMEAAAQAMRRLNMAKDLRVVQLAPGYNAIVLDDVETGRPTNLADVGFGVSQVLPIIVALASMHRGGLALIEQPELHLHPDSQGQLADVLIDLARSRGLTLAIESHSEHLLLRIQRRVAEGSLSSDDVAIYVVDGGDVKLAELDEYGSLDGSAFPRGFFEEEFNEVLLTAQAAVRRRART